jgi:hypothetical protein
VRDSAGTLHETVVGNMTDLEHGSGDCTGHWRLIGSGQGRRVRCEACDAEYVATAERRLAAIDENYAGIYLRRLAAEGAAQIEAERGRSA